jgi:hypothetical protein
VSDALKGDLIFPSEPLEKHFLETLACDASDPELVRAVCRFVLWPSLLLEAAAAEADLGEGSSEVSALVADASRGLHRMFSKRELARLVETQRIGELNALAKGKRGSTF